MLLAARVRCSGLLSPHLGGNDGWMRDVRLLIALGVACSLAACVSTTRNAAEYKQHYVLAEDVHLYRCHSFTGIHSVWFAGPEDVETICSAKIPVAKAAIIRKGSPVRILKLFKVAAIGASYSDAKLQILDRDTKAIHVVYVKWPGSKGLITNEPPGLQ